MSQSALSDSFEYLCYGSTVIRNIWILSVRGPSLDIRIWRLHLYTSESDVYRRRILTYKDAPRTERVKVAVHYATTAGYRFGHIYAFSTHRCRSSQHLRSECNIRPINTTSTRCWTNDGLLLVQRRVRWTNIKLTLVQRLVDWKLIFHYYRWWSFFDLHLVFEGQKRVKIVVLWVPCPKIRHITLAYRIFR